MMLCLSASAFKWLEWAVFLAVLGYFISRVIRFEFVITMNTVQAYKLQFPDPLLGTQSEHRHRGCQLQLGTLPVSVRRQL